MGTILQICSHDVRDVRDDRDDRDVREGVGGSHGQEGVERTGGHSQGLGDGVGGLDRDGEHDGGALGTGTLQGVFRL